MLRRGLESCSQHIDWTVLDFANWSSEHTLSNESVHSAQTKLTWTDTSIQLPAMFAVHWPCASTSWLYFLLIGFSITRTAGAQLDLNTCIPMQLFLRTHQFSPCAVNTFLSHHKAVNSDSCSRMLSLTVLSQWPVTACPHRWLAAPRHPFLHVPLAENPAAQSAEADTQLQCLPSSNECHWWRRSLLVPRQTSVAAHNR